MIDYKANNRNYELLWKSTDVTICGFFKGSMSNEDERVYANLGYGNKIVRVIDKDKKHVYSLGQKVEFNKRILDSHLKEIKEATISEFCIDGFSKKIMARFEEKVGLIELLDCDPISKKIIIAGTRTFNDYDMLKRYCDYLLQNIKDPIIVSGNAPGADKLGERYAKEKGFELKIFPANWISMVMLLAQ